MITDTDIAAERRALDAAAREAEFQSLHPKRSFSSAGKSFELRRAHAINERDCTRLTAPQRAALAAGDSVVEWIDNGGTQWRAADSVEAWRIAIGLPIELPVWINGYRITRMTPAELQGLADRIARGEE